MADSKCFSPDQQVRLMVWAVPRSVSTALTKCLSFLEDSLVFFEPYLCAFWFGPDKIVLKLPDAESEERIESFKKETAEVTTSAETGGFEASQCSYKWVKEQLEDGHSGKKLIVCKEMAFSVADFWAFLPNGYRHVFLVRHPLKVFVSMKKMFQFIVKKPLDAFEIDGLPRLPARDCFKNMSGLIDHLKEVHDQEAIVIDADDLLADPKGILSALFKAVGLPFEEKILNWEAGEAISKQWVISKMILKGNEFGKYYKNAFDSTCFMKPHGFPESSSLSPDILRCVDASMPYYEKMYAQRLKPE